MAENAQLRLRMETDLGRAALSDLLQRMSAKVKRPPQLPQPDLPSRVPDFPHTWGGTHHV